MLRAVSTVVLALALPLLAACGNEADTKNSESESTTTPTSQVEVADGWVRATTGTEDPSMTGAFMTITNSGDAAVTLTGASTEVAGMTQLHTMQNQDGKMVMVEVKDGLEIPAGGSLELKPGGDHVMLMGLTKDLAAGDEVEMSVAFDGGSEIDLTLPVKEYTEETGHYHPSVTPSPTE